MEITTRLELTSEQESLVDMHSVLNILNVVNLQILEIGQLLDASDETDPLLDELSNAADLLKDPEEAHRVVSGMEAFISKLENTIDGIAARSGPQAEELIRSHRENLRSIYAIIRIRAEEIQSRQGAGEVWVEHSPSELKSRFDQFLQAVEKNSHGGYRIVKNLADKEDRDYLVNFEVTSDEEDFLLMPIVFQDVMRDILANARKYTRPGGKITGGLHFGNGALRYVVEDTGIGIPEDEIENVVRFGYRGENILDRPTRGGGFGLTKAYSVTRRHNGRMWIESGPSGTKVEIQVPVPGAGRNTAASRGETELQEA